MRENSDAFYLDQKKDMLNLPELSRLINEHKKNEDKILDSYEKFKLVDRIQKLKEVNRAFLEQLLEKKEYFDKVFSTAKGSFYFILKTGESLRIKQNNNTSDPQYEVQPILSEIFFITGTEAERIYKNHVLDWPGGSIKTTDYGIGASPLEFNIKESESRIIFDKEGNDLKNIRSKFKDRNKNNEEPLSGAYHIGHPISEIIK